MLGLSNKLSHSTGEQLGTTAAGKLVSDFVDRVTAAGGTVEATACMTRELYDLGVRNTYDYTDSIFERWTNAGATIEAESCFINTYFYLNTER